MTSICEKKSSTEVWLIHAEQISLYKFHRFNPLFTTTRYLQETSKMLLFLMNIHEVIAKIQKNLFWVWLLL